MKIFLLPNPLKKNAIQVAEHAVSILATAGATIVMEEEHQKYGFGDVGFCSCSEAWQSCDLVVTLGGDGTILHVAQQAMQHQKPVLGVNFGRLGYLTALEKDELEKLRRLLAGQYVVENRSMLAFKITGSEHAGFALNDITFFKAQPERIVNVDIYCDETKISSFRGDGVVFATPTGSTAYSMSAGGPIVDARLGGIIATQICAHIVKMPSMVFAGDRVLRVVSKCAGGDRVLVSYDGHASHTLPDHAEAVIYQSEHTMPLVQFSDANQLQAIDNKLKGR